MFQIYVGSALNTYLHVLMMTLIMVWAVGCGSCIGEMVISCLICDATQPGNSCMQIPPEDAHEFWGNATTSEDCLVLNIWTPNAGNNNSSKGSPLKPVMFWIYGGGLTSGSIFFHDYNGSVLATHDVLLVAPNYRLGPFGFLYGGDETAPGNVGFYDHLSTI
ncbi:unnamed protein product [Oppiella nova]|uniref:Carboxylesterase type B domain-containing protein n=1 Tax=Oppiella nova TaxID=334625 RepID=A0A7R9M5L9_9ACAR|nr:unnamed protein product [Oppiella nova]CAG2170939.1 unnamed protein product [Oppiella nova]